MDDVRSKGVLLATFLMVICCDVAFSLGCSLKQADIVFVVDASCSIGDENWSKQLNFVVDVINSFEVGHAKVRIGMITFNSEVKNQFHLNLFNDTAAIVRKVKGTKYTRGGTQTWKVVQYLLTQSFTKANGSRSGVPHIAIFLTDGYSANTRLTISEAARLRANKIRVFAIGVGPRLNMEELNALGTDSESVFIVSHFNALNETKTKILEKACTDRTLFWCSSSEKSPFVPLYMYMEIRHCQVFTRKVEIPESSKKHQKFVHSPEVSGHSTQTTKIVNKIQ